MKPTLIGSGYECCVYDLHNGKVYKEYTHTTFDKAPSLNKEQIKFVVELARKAAKNGIGPKVYYTRKHGYVTERVENPGKVSEEEFDIFLDKVHEVFGGRFDADLCTFYIREDNLGRKNGQLMLIDFGPEST